MADPKIRYDIEATASGEADVTRLAAALDKVDSAIDPAAAARAKELAAELRTLGQQQAAINTFVELKNKSQAGRAALDELQASAQKAAQALRNTEEPTRAQTGQLEKLKDAVKASKAEVISQTAALDASRAELTRLGLASENAANGQRLIRAAMESTRAEAQAVATGYAAQAQAAAKSATSQVASHRSVKEGLAGIGEQLRQLQTLAAVAIGGGVFGGLARDVSATADAYSNLAARIKLTSGEGKAFDTAFQGVFEVAKRTNSSLEETGNLFTKIAQAGKDIGVSQAAALNLTETINQAIQLSGGSADSAKAAVVQLIQGLQSGVLRGEEFNSVLEQSPRLAQALADGLGLTTGKLRDLAQQGGLTTQTVIQALQGQSAAVQREFNQLPPTVGRAIQNLSTEWTRYVGEVDKANGVSATAAQAIGLLSGHLSELGTALKTVGEAWLAYKAFDLAGSFLRQTAAIQAEVAAQAEEAAARLRSTAVIGANTQATAANTVAKVENAAASTAVAAAESKAAAAGAATSASLVQRVGILGRFAGALGLVVTGVALFGDLAVKAFSVAGTFIGEGIAKLQGYRDRTAEVEAATRGAAEAARINAQANAEWAAKAQAAADASLGLSVNAKALVGEFDDLRKKGDGVGEALDKVAKKLDLGDVQGIKDAGAALDALALRGVLDATQIGEALAKALTGKDLGIFEANARAAFDNTSQGARRLQAAIDAIGNESLRRAGTSVQELKTGFSEAAVSAINDLDALAASLDRIGAKGDDARRVLAGALDKALEAAKTERAVQAVIDRMIELGRQGKLSGDQLRDGLEGARKKADDLKSGINSLAEAYRTFGIKTRDELQGVADKAKAAFAVINADPTASLAIKQQAFKQYAEAAIAANNGVATSTITAQAQALKLAISFDETGKAIVQAMDAAGGSIDKTKQKVNELGQAVNDAGEAINAMAGGIKGTTGSTPLTGVRTTGNADDKLAADGGKNLSVLSPTGSSSFTSTAQIPVPAGYYFTLDPYAPGAHPAGSAPNGQPYGGYFAPLPGTQTFGNQLATKSAVQLPGSGQTLTEPGTGGAQASNVLGVYKIEFVIGGSQHTVSTSDKATAENLIRELQDAFKQAGGG